MNFLQKRRIRKRAYETIRHATHLENMRGDLISDGDRQRIEEAKSKVRADLTSHDVSALEISIGELYQLVAELSPTYRFAGIRENLEIFVVAIVVAMGFRSYFLQPFKIPTGSMEPTLYGIHSKEVDDPTMWDRAPLKYAKWLITGRMYHEVRVSGSGQLSHPQQGGQNHPASVFYYVGSKRYKVPRYASLNYRPGEFIQMGSILWSGSITAGDHVFVNKVAWNFRNPRRGEIMVFDTENIPTLPAGTHYIKRMVGLPTEKISISPPDLKINGEIVREPEGIRRIAEQDEGYWGYRVRPESKVLSSPDDSIELADDEYFALGDNTLNSRDGRYWGAVPEENLVGPALLIYWPFSKRWGLAD
jgi:signal peptidase I